MKNRAYELLGLTGVSGHSVQNWCWFQAVETRGDRAPGKIYQCR